MGRPAGSKNLPQIRDFLNTGDRQKLVDKMRSKALEGDSIMLKFLGEMIFGKAQQSIDLGGEISLEVVKGFNFISNETNNNTDNKTGTSVETTTG